VPHTPRFLLKMGKVGFVPAQERSGEQSGRPGAGQSTDAFPTGANRASAGAVGPGHPVGCRGGGEDRRRGSAGKREGETSGATSEQRDRDGHPAGGAPERPDRGVRCKRPPRHAVPQHWKPHKPGAWGERSFVHSFHRSLCTPTASERRRCRGDEGRNHCTGAQDQPAMLD
jgi:hypothetical protein